MTQISSAEAKPSGELGPTARLQFRIDQQKVPWMFAALRNEHEVNLYQGDFPDPFSKLAYTVRLNENRLLLLAGFSLREDFNLLYGRTIGSPQALAPLLRKYPQSEFSPDRQRLTISRDGQTYGVIVRPPGNIVAIQRGGQAGQVALAEDRPVNSLSTNLDSFSTLVQRYVSAIWNASPETDQKRLNLTLDIPTLPDGAPETYFSTFEIVAPEFRGRPRPVDLDSEIGGYPLVKALVRSLILDLTNPEASRRFGTQPFSNKLVLVTGVEGTGKSLFPKAMDVILRSYFGDTFEHYRLSLQDMLLNYGIHTTAIVETIFDHVVSNEKRKIPTLLHLDNLDALIPPNQRRSLWMPVSREEFYYYKQTLDPILTSLRKFGRELGGESHSVIVYGESRLRRSELPGSVAQTFRRTFHLEPNREDLVDILRMQIRQSRKFAERTQHDPFTPDIDSQVDRIAERALGATGRDIQQVLLNIATRHKALWDGETDIPVTPEEIVEELSEVLLAQGIEYKPRGQMGFVHN